MSNEKEKKNIDWERIEIDYRAGIKTLRDIAGEHGIVHGYITKRAKRDGWVRDLTAKIQARADEIVAKKSVSKEVAKERRILEQTVIEANAQHNAEVDLSHRGGASFSRQIVDSLMLELKDQIEQRVEYQHLGEMLRNPDAFGNDKLNDQYMKTVSFSGRVDNIKKLVDAQKVVIELERRVYKIDTDPLGDENKKMNVVINFV